MKGKMDADRQSSRIAAAMAFGLFRRERVRFFFFLLSYYLSASGLRPINANKMNSALEAAQGKVLQTLVKTNAAIERNTTKR